MDYIGLDPDTLQSAKGIRLLLMDCDGVLTDGRLYYGETGEVIKVFDVQDGLGIVRWHEAGFHSGIITGRSSPVVRRRADELRMGFVVQGSKDKLNGAKKICEALGLGLEETAFVGDDLPDIDAISKVGFGVAVANAVEPVKRISKYTTKLPGGRGAVREVIELLLAAKD
jgi:3-deoxy-D-manno-octulosonate 8-phosphate phosphatase (KDO 8-P phosphatase)